MADFPLLFIAKSLCQSIGKGKCWQIGWFWCDNNASKLNKADSFLGL